MSTNSESRIERLIRISAKNQFPAEIHIEPTNHCNKKCSMCATRNRYKENLFPMGYIDINMYEDIIDEIGSMELEEVHVNLHKDGEPLLHPDIGYLIKYAKTYSIFVSFATNGILLRAKTDEIIYSGLDLLTISVIDNTALTSIEYFLKAKGRGNLPFTQLKIFNGEAVDPVRMANIAQLADKAYIFHGLHNWTDDPYDNKKLPCRKLQYSLAVNWDGTISPCCLDYRRDMWLGKYPITSLNEAFKFTQWVYRQQKYCKWQAPCNTCSYIQRLDEDETKICLKQDI